MMELCLLNEASTRMAFSDVAQGWMPEFSPNSRLRPTV